MEVETKEKSKVVRRQHKKILPLILSFKDAHINKINSIFGLINNVNFIYKLHNDFEERFMNEKELEKDEAIIIDIFSCGNNKIKGELVFSIKDRKKSILDYNLRVDPKGVIYNKKHNVEIFPTYDGVVKDIDRLLLRTKINGTSIRHILTNCIKAEGILKNEKRILNKSIIRNLKSGQIEFNNNLVILCFLGERILIRLLAYSNQLIFTTKNDEIHKIIENWLNLTSPTEISV